MVYLFWFVYVQVAIGTAVEVAMASKGKHSTLASIAMGAIVGFFWPIMFASHHTGSNIT